MTSGDDNLDTLRSVADFIRWGASKLTRKGVHFGHGTDSAADEARILVFHALALDPMVPDYFYDGALTSSERSLVVRLVNARIRDRRPAPYLINEAWFAGLRFYVDKRVIIPRSPLAELIERGFEPWIDPDRIDRVLDLCTGSGCIAIACAHYLPSASIDATDLSPKALEVARRNVREHGLEDRVHLEASDLFDALDGRRYDVIVSNPPYVAEAELPQLPDEFRHEPRMALVSGDDGLDAVRVILREAGRHLVDDGVLIVEVGASAGAVAREWPQVPFTWLEFERGGEGVFLLTAGELAAYADHFSVEGERS